MSAKVAMRMMRSECPRPREFEATTIPPPHIRIRWAALSTTEQLQVVQMRRGALGDIYLPK